MFHHRKSVGSVGYMRVGNTAAFDRDDLSYSDVPLVPHPETSDANAQHGSESEQ
ncbi:MAG TPA: hypothetical protein VFW23_00205 [Tepidisphaeraceae bacterium]|nr:hypothetical protein [Tepidisphaeraceae bacterium]